MDVFPLGITLDEVGLMARIDIVRQHAINALDPWLSSILVDRIDRKEALHLGLNPLLDRPLRIRLVQMQAAVDAAVAPLRCGPISEIRDAITSN